MMTYQSEAVARHRIQEARDRADLRRLAKRAAGAEMADHHGVIDAVGHGLIALGSRLVSDPTDHPPHRRAA